MHRFLHFSHSDYYTDRRSERDLCYDFPGDEILIEGLHAMQVHFWRNGRSIDIPVVDVMNAAHYIAAYMFTIPCEGEQEEYDMMAYVSLGRNKQLMFLTLVVLAAMLHRTKGYRAIQCRDIILENRSEDFEEGVSLYERFLSSAEKRFAEEDFLIDIPYMVAQMQEKDAIITQQAQQIQQLQYTITVMEKQQNTQYNNCVIYQAPVYNTSTTNNYYAPANQSQQTQNEDQACSEKEQATAAQYENILPIPKKGKYTEVRRYIEERCKFDEEFRLFVEQHSRVELCMRLTDEFGWDVDEHALGVNMNRNR